MGKIKNYLISLADDISLFCMEFDAYELMDLEISDYDLFYETQKLLLNNPKALISYLSEFDMPGAEEQAQGLIKRIEQFI